MQEQATDAVTGETGSSTHLRKRKRAAVVKKPRKGGTERFRRAVDRIMGRDSAGLVEMLFQKALKGDLATVKALVEFGEGKKPQAEPKKKRSGPTASQELAMEEEWVGPMEEIGKGAGEWWKGK